MMHLLEKDVQKAIQQAFLLKHHIKLIPIDAGGKGMRRAGHGGSTGIPDGFPDLFGIDPDTGKTILIEVKRPGCKPDKAQRDFLAWASQQHAIAFWADSVDSALSQFHQQKTPAGSGASQER